MGADRNSTRSQQLNGAHPSEQEAHFAVINALCAIIIADEKCCDAEYGSEVRCALAEARKAVEYAQALIEGRV